jgi:hypothetical protein
MEKQLPASAPENTREQIRSKTEMYKKVQNALNDEKAAMYQVIYQN